MARFDLSGFAPAVDEAAPAAPPPAADPIDTIRINGALNDFLAAKQDALFDAPDAFYRTTGRDAVEAAPAAYDRLDRLSTDTLAGLDNDTQRRHLRDQLDAQLSLAREDMGRHVAEQTKAWQRQTARDRVDLLTKEAALHHGDAGLHDNLATAAEVAARAHAAPDEADPAAAGARSGIFHAAIQALLDRGNTEDAAAALDRRKDQLSEEHAGTLQAQLATARRFDAARAYADSVVPTEPPATLDEIEAQRAAALDRAMADHADDPAQQLLAQHFVESAYDRHRGTLGRIRDDIATALEQWRALSTGQGLPPPSLWNRLDPQQQARLFVQLHLNDGRPTETEPTPAADAAEPTVMSDADPEPMVEGEQYAQAPSPAQAPRSPAPAGTKTPISENELDAAQSLLKEQAAAARRELDMLVSTPRNSDDEKKKGPVPADWEKRLSAATVKAINESAATFGVPRDLLLAILWEESTFEERPRGADPRAQGQGLAGISRIAQDQLIKKAQREHNPERERELRAFDRMKGPDAVSMAAEYLRMHFDKLGQHWPTAVLAYTMGDGNASDWLNGASERIKRNSGDYKDRWTHAQTYLRRIFNGRSHRFDAEEAPEYP